MEELEEEKEKASESKRTGLVSEKEDSFKQERINKIALSYYSRQDVRKAIYDFCQNRETVPRYFEGFGKRPDALQYDSDIINFVKNGATSVHCSEEIWKDALQLTTEMSEEQLNELREGWDLLIDIDCPYLEYSKKAAQALLRALEFHGVKNVGVKFSGSKGLHIIVPWKAFPKEIYGEETRKKFPEFPRLVCQYLMEVARPILEKEMEKEELKFTSQLEKGVVCDKCKKISQEVTKIVIYCPLCKREESSEIIGEPKIKKCPECRFELREKEKKLFYKCDKCNLNSLDSPGNFKKSSLDIFKILGVDVVLVSSRHLFRAPYSLHEKTALASIVLDNNKVSEFQINDASPLKVQIKNFYPDAGESEARELLLQAIDWGKAKEQTEKKEKSEGKQSGYKEIVIKDLTPNLYPPCILEISKGIKQDGRKRALFILINFFKSLKLSNEELEKKIEEWNKKNYKPLKQGYITSQLNWHVRQKAMLPPNCDKPHYKDLAVCKTDSFCKFIKNPVNYAIKKSFFTKRKGKQNK